MSAFKQSMRKLGVRAGLLAGASAAVLAISGIGAGSAMAAPTCPGGTIAGQGSTLQKNAQLNTWNPKYNTACGAGSVAYTGTGSGAGLKALGFTGTEIEHAWQFIGTDEAPTKLQIEASNKLSKTSAVIVPVTQTAIAVVVNPPTGCKFKANKGITWAELNKAFGGNGITTWNQFSNVEGTCSSAITRVVRSDASGTTYQFKNYLSALGTNTEIKAEGLPCTTAGVTNWAGLRTNNGGSPLPNPNVTWPQCSGSTKVTAVEGGGGVANAVATTPGTIGYAALPDAKAKGATAALIQNGVTSGAARYASPENTTTSTARCENSRYTVPSGASGGLNIDWSTAFGAQPTIGGTEYPLCTLTFDVGFHNAVTAGYTAAQGKEVVDYFKNYVVPTAAGQTDLKGTWYSTLPTNVQEAAVSAAAQLG
jgi:ABC-type phosphate transport system substrate-binding protein